MNKRQKNTGGAFSIITRHGSPDVSISNEGNSFKTIAEPDESNILRAVAVDEAVENGNIEVLRDLVLVQGANVNKTSGISSSTPLVRAILNDKKEMVIFLIECGAEVDLCSHYQEKSHRLPICIPASPLEIAMLYGLVDMAEILLDCGAISDQRGKNGFTPLQIAILNDNLNMVSLLMDKRPRSFETGKTTSCWSPLAFAAKESRFSIVELLLKRGFYAELFNYNDRRLLYYAAMRGNVQLASHVLKEGFDISDSGGSEFVTPLYKAAECGQMDMVIFLIEKSADVNLGGVHKFNKFETPLSIAAEEGHPDVVRFLLTKLAKYNENLPDEIPTPFYKALLNGHADVVDILLNIHEFEGGGKPFVNSKSELMHPMHLAAERGFTDIVKLFLEKNCYPFEVDDPNSSLHIACRNGHTEVVVTLLQDRRIDVNNCSCTTGEVPLFSARRLDILEILLNANADVHVRNQRNGKTILSDFAINGNVKAVKLLLSFGADPTAPWVDELGVQTPYKAALDNQHILCFRHLKTAMEVRSFGLTKTDYFGSFCKAVVWRQEKLNQRKAAAAASATAAEAAALKAATESEAAVGTEVAEAPPPAAAAAVAAAAAEEMLNGFVDVEEEVPRQLFEREFDRWLPYITWKYQALMLLSARKALHDYENAVKLFSVKITFRTHKDCTPRYDYDLMKRRIIHNGVPGLSEKIKSFMTNMTQIEVQHTRLLIEYFKVLEQVHPERFSRVAKELKELCSPASLALENTASLGESASPREACNRTGEIESLRLRLLAANEAWEQKSFAADAASRSADATYAAARAAAESVQAAADTVSMLKLALEDAEKRPLIRA